MKRKRLDTARKAEAVLFAVFFGDEAACARYQVSARSLRRYRHLLRAGDPQLSATVRRYAAALAPRRSDIQPSNTQSDA